MSENLLEVSVVASRLKCSVESVYRHRKQPDSPLEFVKSGPRKGYRVKESSVEKLLSSRGDA